MKDKDFLLSTTLCIIFILSGMIGAFFIESSMEKQIPAQASNLGNISSKEGKKELNKIIDNNEQMSKESASDLVSYFYYSINSKDYETAYSLLGSGCQKKINYNSFKTRYVNTDSIKIDNIVSGDLEGGCFKVIADIDSIERSGKRMEVNKYKTIYTIALENKKLKIIKEDDNSLQ